MTLPNGLAGGISPAAAVLLAEVLGLAFIGLLSVASFSAGRRGRRLALRRA